MGTHRKLIVKLAIFFVTLLTSPIKLSAATPVYCNGLHNIGNLVFGITNYGTFGRPPFLDCFTNKRVMMAEFPKGSNTIHLYRAGLWVGAVIGRDTLVSTATESNVRAREFNPDIPPFGDMIYRSTADPELPGYDEAVSEQDFIAIYTDTFKTGVPDLASDPVDFRGHKPLGIEVTQSSYAWSFSYTEDFVLINYRIKNIGENTLKGMYVGLYMDADVHDGSTVLQGNNPTPDLPIKEPTQGLDDLTGFIKDYIRNEDNCNVKYDLNLVWNADNDGDANGPNWMARNIIGVRYLPQPEEDENLNYNWWVFDYNPAFDFGPQQKRNYRYMGNGIGTPIGDRSKYFMMRNGEQDYDQAYTFSISPYNPVWIQPDPRKAGLWFAGADNQWVLSIGPYNLQPGSDVDFPIAYVGGEMFHINPFYWKIYLAGYNDPERYYERLDWTDLMDNAIWAGWVYDNPGVDTDNDGYAGKFQLCVLDSQLVDSVWKPSVIETVYYEGDGVPDYRGATPPPAPKIWLSRTINGLKIRFNGERSETTKDIFSGIIDFEGYNVYLARDNREQSYSLVATYDRQNYRKFIFNPNLKPLPDYEMELSVPYTLEQLKCLYGGGPDPCNDSSFDPLIYTPSRPYHHPLYPDSVFYFVRHSGNVSRLGVDTPIRKIYPNQPPPSAPPVDSDYTEDGYLKYYEYEFEITKLLPTVRYYMNVTAFDFGSPETGLDPLETSVVLGSQDGFAAGSQEDLSGDTKDVYVYPNPYRIDQDYRGRGFESLTNEFLPDDKVRTINFGNLPPKCTIRIFSIDGDLIRELSHDVPASNPTSTHAQWDLITRNQQIVVSGLYYWSVEYPDGSTQIGKLVILF